MGTLKKIVILHGWTYSLNKWQIFTKCLRDAGFDVEIVKIPGLTAETSEIWNLDKYVEWLNKKINGKVILLGHSNGGRIAIGFAAKHPNKIERLILIDSAGIYHKEHSIKIKRMVFGTIAKIGKRLTKSDFLRKFLYRMAGERDYADATPNMRQTMISLINRDLAPELKSLKTPTLIIWGENDKITPLSDGRLINSLIKKSKLEIVRSAKHSPYYTHPREVLEIIKNDI